MTVTLGQIVALLDDFYPPGSALSWDRVGLVTGDLGQPIGHVHFAVDPTLAVIDEAIAAGADLLVIGRPITGAADPAAAAREIAREIDAGLAG